jgi:hypothetical protein
MIVLRHAALHAQEQQIVWQQILIEFKEYVWRLIKVKLPPTQKTNSSQPKNRCLAYCGFFAGVAGLDAAGGALVSSVADFMVSSFGQPLSRYGFPWLSIFGWSGPALSPYWS